MKELIREYYFRAGGRTSPIDMFEFLVWSGAENFDALDAVIVEFGLDEEDDKEVMDYLNQECEL